MGFAFLLYACFVESLNFQLPKITEDEIMTLKMEKQISCLVQCEKYLIS